ncbi:MAG: SIMPL domain-containing protein [Patescibacteria group bacterium]|nr:SIMPL domain-containing protein [Patescibacteria group bacterium]MDE2172542.1 SIMPL domain-containing protein [Patescibacteria group bacterium]
MTSTPQRFWNALMGLIGVLTVLAVVYIVKEIKSIGYVGANPNVTNTITVDGSGDAVAIPDVATFSFTVTETAKTVADAQSAATAKNNAAIKAMKDAGVADTDIQTTSYSINPHYEYQTATCQMNGFCPPGKSVLTGYDVSQTTEIKVRDLSQAGTLFSAIGALGVQNVNGLSFSVDNPETVNAEARSKAIANAQSKADELAKELGVSLGSVVSFSENNGVRAPVVYGLNSMSAASAPTAAPAPDISTGEQKVTDNVEITYEIR